MKRSAFALVFLAFLSAMAVVFGQTAAVQQRSPASASAVPRPVQVPAQPIGAAQRKLLDQYCVSCHNDDTASGNLMLDTADLSHVSKDAERFEKVVRKLRAGMMPPAGSPRPDRAIYQALILWLENELDRGATPYTPAPGLHRLNRTEYANAIRDLLALDIDPSKYLPSDDSTHGFDNMAGTLGVSSTLVEAYVTAAGKIGHLAIGDAIAPTQITYRAPEDTSQDYHIEGLPFGTRGGMAVEHVFPADGEYVVNVFTIFGDNMTTGAFGSVPCEKVEVLLDGERLQLMNWGGGGGRGGGGGNCGGATAAPAAAQGGGQRGGAPAAQGAQRGGQGGGANQGGGGGGRGGGNAPLGLQGTVRFKTTAGKHLVGVTFLTTNFAPLLDIDRHFMRNTIQTGPTPGFTFFPHVGKIRIDGPNNATAAKDSPSRKKIFICQPTTAALESACARTIVTNLANRAFRRPATAEDITTLMGFYEVGRKSGKFDSGIESALERILTDLKFIYRMELEPATVKPGEPYRISDLELASRLSFFLWSTSPDDQLTNLAVQGRLKDPLILEQQVRRMLKDPRAEALAVNFAGQWLNLRGMGAVGPLPMIYPDFDDPLRQAMRREVELLFDSIVREDRSVLDLLTTDDTFVNERLAKHYGIPNIYGSQFRRIKLGPEFDLRRGLLGKGALLTTTSKAERNSPVARGKWIMANLLGVPPPDPPQNVPPLPPRKGDVAGNTKEPSMREKMLEHRTQGSSCVQCHRLMDPIGFSLENFDAIGLWRTKDEGNAINASVELYDGMKVDGPAGLRQWLLGYSDQFVRVASEKLLAYALGRGVEYQDMPVVRSIARDAARNNNRFSSIVMGVVKSAPFQMNTKVKQTD